MNIVRFKDIIKEGDDLFNDKFRGKYCYCVNWKWCIALEDTTNPEFVQMSIDDVIPSSIDSIAFEDYLEYYDPETTERINTVEYYLYLNEHVPEELTLDMLKRFRTMVAETLLGCYTSWDDEYDEVNTPKITSMLEYYEANMSNCATNSLMTFSDPTIHTNGTYTDCGCGSKANATMPSINPGINMLSNYTKTCNCGNDAIAALFATTGCDCVSLYRKAVYNYMVSVFSDYKFWKCIPNEILDLYIRYIDGIIKAGLPLNVSTLNVSSLLYGDCSCLSQDSQSGNLLILNNLKKAFQYIIDGDIVAHKNFIFETLYAWSAKLYEVMEW